MNARVASGSIATRLTLGLAAIALAVFVSVGLLLQWALDRELRRVELQEIEGKADVVRHFLGEAREDNDLAALRHHLDDLLIGNMQMRIWLLGAGGAVLYGGRQPPLVRPQADGGLLVAHEDGVWLSGRRWAITTASTSASASASGLPASELIVAFDTRGRERLMRDYRFAILLVCGLGLGVVIASCAWITRRQLAPVRRLAREAAAIAPESLATRLSAAGVADELQSLVHGFNHALDRVEAAYAQLEAFNADVAHELRTPLATLISGTEVALGRPRSNDELQQTLAANLDELRQMSGLINDMLFLAQAERGGTLREPVSVDLREQARQVAEYFDAALDERRQAITIEGQASAPANAALLRRALVNLVSNASRYTPTGQSISIALRQDARAASIAVRNPGPPIPDALRPRLFERFVRADAARTRSAENHGLGLAIVRAIAKMHGGDVFARSAGGVTEVGFTLSRSVQ